MRISSIQAKIVSPTVPTCARLVCVTSATRFNNGCDQADVFVDNRPVIEIYLVKRICVSLSKQTLISKIGANERVDAHISEGEL